MRPNWLPILAGDAEYVEGATKFQADASGISDLRDLPTVAPDDRPIPGGGWTVVRVPNENIIGSRLIATKL